MPDGLEHARFEAMSSEPERLLTLREVAGYLMVSQRTVRRLIAAGDLPCLRIGSQIRFEPATLLRWISAQKGG